jgi:hypothetical protein
MQDMLWAFGFWMTPSVALQVIGRGRGFTGDDEPCQAPRAARLSQQSIHLRIATADMFIYRGWVGFQGSAIKPQKSIRSGYSDVKFFHSFYSSIFFV